MITRRLYTIFFYCLLPAILLRLLIRSLKAPAYRSRWAERFGIFPAPQKPESAIWLHAVSVGETLAAVPLIRKLQQEYPNKLLVITTTTPTGSERVRSIFSQEIVEKKVLHVYAPYDIPWALNNFLERTNPTLTVIMETELWPNMIHSCFVHDIPVVVANARLSEKSAKGYSRFSCLTKTMLTEINLVAVQNQQDGNRFIQLGLSKEKCQVTGSIKFDLNLSAEVQQLAEKLRSSWSSNNTRLVLLAASTHPGEDEIIITLFRQWKKTMPSLLLVLVPRHPERFNNVYQQCVQQGFKTLRRSENLIDANADIVLGDTMGELLAFYGACDIAFVGGSLVPVGGHNLMEPATWGKPLVSGKYLFNFAEAAELFTQQEALLVCETEADLQRDIAMLLFNEERRKAMGHAAQKIVNENRGALQRLILEIKSLIP